MLKRWMERLEGWLNGDEAGRERRQPGQGGGLLRVCFDGRGEEAGAGPPPTSDLVVAPAVWHRRGELLLCVVAQLERCAKRGGPSAELTVLLDAADGRMARQSRVLSGVRREGVRVVVRVA